jgi:predicted DNA-binding WGR domain protein
MPPRKRDVKASDKTAKAVAESAPVAPAALALKLVSTPTPHSRSYPNTQLTYSTGGVFVDHFVPKAQDYKVLFTASTALACYLMWSEIKNNHNKFYVVQALHHTNGSNYLWTRYVRLGLHVVGTPESYPSLEACTAAYNKKHREKTNKEYIEVKMALGKPNAGIEVKMEEKKNVKNDDKKTGPSLSSMITCKL